MLSDKIESFIRYHRSLNHQNIKIVMTDDFYKKFIKEILKDSPVQELTDSIPLEEEQNSEFMGCPIEINDKIVTDFYVCEIL